MAANAAPKAAMPKRVSGLPVGELFELHPPPDFGGFVTSGSVGPWSCCGGMSGVPLSWGTSG